MDASWFFIVLGAGLAISLLIHIGKKSIQKSGRDLMTTHIDEMDNFESTQGFMGSDGATGIAIDEKARTICTTSQTDTKVSSRVLPYKDILAVEIVEDGSTLTRTKRGSQVGGALLGGIMLGPLGAVVGGLSGAKSSSEKVKKLELKIIVNDTSAPIHNINFLNEEVKKSHPWYKTAYEKASRWHAIITIIIKSIDEHDEIEPISDSTSSDQETIMYARLRELASLRDDGIITDEEFNDQKRKILRV